MPVASATGNQLNTLGNAKYSYEFGQLRLVDAKYSYKFGDYWNRCHTQYSRVRVSVECVRKQKKKEHIMHIGIQRDGQLSVARFMNSGRK
jgi:hypothetical protein